MLLRPFEDYCSLTIVHAYRRVELVRTARSFSDVSELRPFWQAASERVAELEPGVWSVLSDLRLVAGRNDEEFEREMDACRRPFYQRFKRSAVVVRSSVGRMHITRSTTEDGVPTGVFTDLEAARAWLRTAAD